MLVHPPLAFPSSFPLFENTTIHHRTGFVSKLVLFIPKAFSSAGFGTALRTSCKCVCICLGVSLKHVWGVRETNDCVCSFCLVSTGPMCVDRASTHTAVQAGRLCPEATSVLFVSCIFFVLAHFVVISCHHVWLKTNNKLSLTYSVASFFPSDLQEFVRRWLLLQTQHVHLLKWPALSQLWIRRRRSANYKHSILALSAKSA